MTESDISTEPGGAFDGEPTRWLDDPSAAASLRGDLALGASATAGGVDYAATLTALRGAIAAQTGALAPAAVAGKSLGLKIALGGVLAIGAAAAWWTMREGARNDAAPTHDARPVPVAVEQTPAPKPAVERARVPEEPTPVVVADPIPEPPAAVVDPVSTSTDEPTEKVRKPKPIESDDDRYLREAQLVATARKQLGTSPQQALASTKKHSREFPKGALVEEARAIEIRALAKLGRMDDAQRKADDFLGTFGDGAHAAAVRRAIAGDDDVQ